MVTMLTGRGLWFGAVDASGNRRIFTETQWHTACALAASWGISVVHPKVAEGTQVWYNAAGLQMLKSIADTYHLVCSPYIYSHGDELGALEGEAQVCAGIGNFFGSVCPDIEKEWERPEAATWATRYGQLVRKQYSGPIYPTVFANPNDHPLPWGELNQFATGFLPQVYFDLWSPPTAQHAIDFVFPQWQALDARCRNWGNKKPLVPMLPIIGLEGAPAPVEVVNWLTKMQHYGYCGFWYDEKYAPYSQHVLIAPKPMFVSASPITPPAVKVVAPPTPIPPAAKVSTPVVPTLVGPVGTTVKETSSSPSPSSSTAIPDLPTVSLPAVVKTSTPPYQAPLPQLPPGPLTFDQLVILWGSVETVTFDGTSPVEQYWCSLVQKEISIGAPIKEKKVVTLPEGETVEYLLCQSGRTLIYFHSNKTVILF